MDITMSHSTDHPVHPAHPAHQSLAALTRVTRLGLLATAALLAACAARAPQPLEPLPTPVPFANAPTPVSTPAEDHRAQDDWWGVFADPTLDELVRQGLQANLDLRMAAERVQQARALAAGVRAQSRPQLGLGAGWREQQLSREEAPGLDRDARRSERASAGLDLSWELDLFGRIASGAAAAQRRTRGTEADAQDMALSIGAEIAQTWFALEGAREQQRLARRVIDNRQATLDLVTRRVRAGYASPLDEARARADLASAQAELPALDAEVAAATHRLAVLLGQSPSQFTAPAPASAPPAPVAVRVPSPERWVAARPDLRAAEARLEAHALDVRSVRAEFLPRLSIAGALGFVAGSLSGLGAAGSAAWFVAPSIGLPVFDGGRIAARLDAANAAQREALLHYRQRLLRATEEVETALVRTGHDHTRVAALQERATQALRAEELARKRFAAGASDLLELLEAQRTAQQAEGSLSSAVTAQRRHLVDLQRALGARFVPATSGQAPDANRSTSATEVVVSPPGMNPPPPSA